MAVAVLPNPVTESHYSVSRMGKTLAGKLVISSFYYQIIFCVNSMALACIALHVFK